MGGWLSKAAVRWAVYEAQDVPAHLLSTLIVIAMHASSDGTGAYISASTVAQLTRKTESQARRNIARLEELKLISRGNQRLVAHIRPDRRPVVYDLPMPERGSTDATPSRPRGSTDAPAGSHTCASGVAPALAKEFLKNSGRRAPRARAGGADASAQPDECARCGGEDHERSECPW